MLIATFVVIVLQNLSEVKDKSLPKYTNPGSSRGKRNIIAKNENEWEQSERDRMALNTMTTNSDPIRVKVFTC